MEDNEAMRTVRIISMTKLLHFFFLAAEGKELLGRVTSRRDCLTHLKRKLSKFCFQGKQFHYKLCFIKGCSFHLQQKERFYTSKRKISA